MRLSPLGQRTVNAGPAMRGTGDHRGRIPASVLDDFQNVAITIADWSPVRDRMEVTGFTGHFATEDELADALAPFGIVVTLRERVPFPAALFARLPRLKLLVASGMRNSVIDHAAAAAHGVTVCGTASSPTPPVELTWALLLGLARGVVHESNALRAGGPWQSTVGASACSVWARSATGWPGSVRRSACLLATPHLGYVSEDNYRTYYGQAVENIEAYLKGQPVRRLG